MLIYEKNNKLNISFENNMEETDIIVGKDEVKIGETTISENNVLPVPEEGDSGKVPIVQSDGSYALGNVGGGANSPITITISEWVDSATWTSDKTWGEIVSAYVAGSVVFCGINNVEYYQAVGYAYDIQGQNIESLVVHSATNLYSINSDGTISQLD